MERQRSTTLPCVSTIMISAPWKLTDSVTCMYAGIIIWRITRHKWYSSLIASLSGLVLSWNTVISSYIELIDFVVEIISTALKCQGKIFRSGGNLPRMHRLMNAVPSNTSTARFLKILNQARTHRSPTQINNGTMTFMLTTRSSARRSHLGLLNRFYSLLPCKW